MSPGMPISNIVLSLQERTIDSVWSRLVPLEESRRRGMLGQYLQGPLRVLPIVWDLVMIRLQRLRKGGL